MLIYSFFEAGDGAEPSACHLCRPHRFRVAMSREGSLLSRFSPRLEMLAPCLALLMAALVAGAAGAGTALSNRDFIPLEDITRGMRGHGLTVFEGARIDTFAVEVVGVQKGNRAAGSIIIIEVSGHDLERSRVAQGMSGSPVFLDGRFAGALAFGWGGALRSLAGVTPAGEILNLPTRSLSSALDLRAGLQPDWNSLLVAAPAEGLARQALGVEAKPPVGMSFSSPWPGPETLLLELMADLLPQEENLGAVRAENWFMRPLGAVAGGGGEAAVSGEFTLKPGSACAVPLITGDAQLGAIGTVTWVDGDDVFMMGHPFMQRGPVDLPLATAEILTVFPSRAISFKMGSVGRIVGTVHHDQRAGLSGTLGRSPRLIPVELEVAAEGPDRQEEIRHYDFAVVNDPLLTPPLVFWTLYNSLLAEGDDGSLQNLEYTLELELAGGDPALQRPLVLSGVAAGPGGAGRLAAQWMSPIQLLLNNSFAPVQLKGVKARLASRRPVATARVLAVNAPRAVSRGQDRLRCSVELAPRHDGPVIREIELSLPTDLEPGEYRLVVASAADFFSLDAQRAAGAFKVRNLDRMLEVLGSSRDAGELTVALLAPGEGVVQGGREMPGLPPGVSRVMSKADMGTSRALADYVVRQSEATPWFLQGHVVRRVRVGEDLEAAPHERRP